MKTRSAVLLLSLAWIFTAQATSTDPSAEDFVAPPLRHARLSFQDVFGGEDLVSVEVADTPAARQRGLMWRKQLADGQGMIFVFPTTEEHSFWMQHTLISLDLIFFDEKWRIVGVLEGLPTENEIPRTVGKASRYVLEVPAGWCARTGVTAKSRVKASGI